MSKNRPDWFRLDPEIFDNPKIQAAVRHGGDGALILYIRGVAYATKHLTSGFVPHMMPAQWHFKSKHAEALELALLWYPTPLDLGEDGWLIHDFSEYNPTKEHWERVGEQRRAASRARWDRDR